ncbi:TonB-dependent receptor [Algivirga pacifica]|uniref:TonB-dependent receptor n=1 Tax=Algivirga pacifica TaxID=1162670 RepID=A0ABP9DFS5_9BACT
MTMSIKQHSLFSLLIVLSLGIVSTVSAQQGRIQGQVTHAGQPVEFVSVGLKGSKIGTTTGKDGTYVLDHIPVGKYTLQLSSVGYLSIKQTVEVQEEVTLQLNFVLEEDEKQMEEVVVTGTMKPTFVSDSPVKIDVVTSKQLEIFLPTASTSLVENMQLVNGVQEVVACGVCYTNSISINGLPGPYTAVLMDGTPIYGNLASVYGLNGIPNMIVDRFEVIKGPSSTLYGSEAVAGVINIITKDPAEQPLLSLDIMGTSHLESFGNIAIAPKIGKSSGYIGLNYAYINDFDDANGDGFGDAANMDRYSLFTKWNIYRKSGKKFTLAGKYYYEDRRNGVEEYLADRNYRTLRGSDTIYGESIYTNRTELFGTYELNTAPSLKVDFSLSHHDQDSYYGSDHYVAQQQIAFANFLWNTNWKKHDILTGLTARYNAYDDNSVATEVEQNGQVINQPNNQFIPGIFVQDEWTIRDNFTLLSGLRMDHYNSHGVIFAPRLSTKWKPSEWTTVRSNFGTGFRIVNLFTEDHAFVTGQREVVIKEELQPEESYNLSLNINQVYASMGGSGSIDVEAYYTHFTNKIIPDYDTPGQIIYANSEGYARTMGVGVTVDHNFDFPLAMNLGVNVQRATETEQNDAGSWETNAIPFAPEWSGVGSINYQWKEKRMVFAYTARVTGVMTLPEVYDLNDQGVPLETPRPTRSTPFSLHNIQVSKQFNKGFSFYTGIQNLFNFRQEASPLIGYNDPNRPIGFSDYFDTSYAYAPNHGRELYLGIKWEY